MADRFDGETFDEDVRQFSKGDPLAGGKDGVSNLPMQDVAGRTNFTRRNNSTKIRHQEEDTTPLSNGNKFTYYAPYDFEVEWIRSQLSALSSSTGNVDVTVEGASILDPVSGMLDLSEVFDDFFFTEANKPTIEKNDKIEIAVESLTGAASGLTVEIIGKRVHRRKSGTFSQRALQNTGIMMIPEVSAAPTISTMVSGVTGYMYGVGGHTETLAISAFIYGTSGS